MKSHQVELVRYCAAGGVVVHFGRVLVLRRPAKGEVRLPKGHIERGETPMAAALREVAEESGYTKLAIVGDLGEQIVEYDLPGRHVIRREQFFLMQLTDMQPTDDCDTPRGEAQFIPEWQPWQSAIDALTFAVEKTWVERAWEKAKQLPNPL